MIGNLLFSEGFSLQLCANHIAYQVATGIACPILDLLEKEIIQFLPCLLRPPGLLRCGEWVESRLYHLVRPGFELLVMCLVDAEHAGNNHHRDRTGKTGDQLEFGFLDAAEHRFSQLSNGLAPGFDAFWLERCADQGAQSMMIGIVQKQHVRLVGKARRAGNHLFREGSRVRLPRVHVDFFVME